LTEAFVDTSFVIALINKSDQYHNQALQLAARFDKRPVVTTDAVLLEIGNALARNFKAQSVQIIEHFVHSDEVHVISLNSELFRRAFELYRTHDDKAWGLVDCISFTVMKDLKLTQSLTADKDFEQAGFEILMGR